VRIIESESKLILWFVLSKQVTKSNDILYGVVYVPPESSDFSTGDPFAEIQGELDSFSNKYSSVCLLGDWNSRIRNMKDYIEPDFDLFHENGLDDLYYEFQSDMECFKDTNINLERVSQDKSCNNFGYKFIEFLQFNNFLILNGRTKGDLIGKNTCKSSSTVDYVCSKNLL
jgi:hypothetical protein